MITSDSRILVLAAHPDDEVLGAGGLMARFSSSNMVEVVIMGEGSSPRFRHGQKSLIADAVKKRSSALRKAMKFLGVKNTYEYNLKCGCFSTHPILEINKIIEQHISSFSPTHILTHHYDDNNNDHRILSRSVDMATRPKPSSSIKAVLHFEVQSSTDWTFSGDSFAPNVFIELSQENLKHKQLAMKFYDTEFNMLTASRSPNGLKVLAQYRGIQSGFGLAEAYSLRRLHLGDQTSQPRLK